MNNQLKGNQVEQEYFDFILTCPWQHHNGYLINNF